MRTSAIWRLLFRMRLTASADLFRAAAWMPATFSTALPAMATTTRPTNASDQPSWAIAGRSAPTNHSDTNAAATAAVPSSPSDIHSGHCLCHRLGGILGRSGATLRVAAERRGQAGDEDDEEHDRDDDAELAGVTEVRRTSGRREGRDGERCDAQDEEDGGVPHRFGVEALPAVAQAADEEGQAQYQERVGQDRTDEGRLHDDDQALAQGEEADEQLRQVAER